MNTSTKPRDQNEPRHLTNIEKVFKEHALKAIETTGQKVEWRDEPSAAMNGYSERGSYGSLWSSEPGRDCSKFWREFDRLRGKPSALD